MDMLIEKANFGDIDEVETLYNDICDYLADKEYNPGWRKGCFPTREEALFFLRDNALYVARKGGKIVGSLALNHTPDDEETENRKTEYADTLFLHLVVVHPACLRQGIGSEMLRFAERIGGQEGVRRLRLYVYEKNDVAIKAYEKSGFRYLEKADIGLKEYGLEWFYLYEKDLEVTCG